MKKQGFTLIELLVVVSIIALLSSIVLSALGNARLKTRDSKRVQETKQLMNALELYRSDHNSYPITGETVVAASTLSTDLIPAYIKSIPEGVSGYLSTNGSSYGLKLYFEDTVKFNSTPSAGNCIYCGTTNSTQCANSFSGFRTDGGSNDYSIRYCKI